MYKNLISSKFLPWFVLSNTSSYILHLQFETAFKYWGNIFNTFFKNMWSLFINYKLQPMMKILTYLYTVNSFKKLGYSMVL